MFSGSNVTLDLNEITGRFLTSSFDGILSRFCGASGQPAIIEFIPFPSNGKTPFDDEEEEDIIIAEPSPIGKNATAIGCDNGGW